MQKLRHLIACEAARIVHDEMVRDYRVARDKACQRLGVQQFNDVPDNQEIHTALIDYLKGFKTDTQLKQVQAKRQEALTAMRFFKDFEPRLAGAVLDGTAAPETPVCLHVFVDASEEVMIHLLNQGIPFETQERRVKYSDQRLDYCTVFSFIVNDIELEIYVLPVNALRQAPLSPITNKPTRRVDYQKLSKLVKEAALFN